MIQLPTALEVPLCRSNEQIIPEFARRLDRQEACSSIEEEPFCLDRGELVSHGAS